MMSLKPAASSFFSVALYQSEASSRLVVLRILDEIGAVEHADIGHEVRQVARVSDVHHVGALADHLVDFLAGAELLAGEDLNLDAAVGASRHVLREELGG